MRIAQISQALLLAFFCVCLQANAQGQKMTVKGKLVRAAGIGGESTGWLIESNSEITIDGRQVRSIEVDYRPAQRLSSLQDKQVEASGTLSRRHGVETGERPVFEIDSIREAPTHAGVVNLTEGEWLLEDLAGSGVLDRVQATLAFPQPGKVAGSASCNRFFGPVQMHGESIKLGPLGSTRMACPEAVMNQETKYLQALQAAESFEWRDPYLLLHCKDLEKPLRFTHKSASTPALH